VNKLSNRLKRLENRMAPHQQTGSRQFTLEQVEGCKALCLAFADRFGKPDPLNWREEKEAEDLQKRGNTWIRNLGCIRAHLARHPDLVGKVEAVPELDTLTRLVHGRR